MTNFLKNLAITGGLLEVCALGAGVLSLDEVLARQGRLLPATSGESKVPT